MSIAEAAPAAEREWPPRRWAALAILIAAGFMDLLDTTIVNVAIPSIRRDIHAGYAEIQWIVAGYILALAVGLITGGRLGDIAGRKRVFIAGVVAFGATSLASGLAPTAGVLVATRVLQGLSAAVMIPQILSVIQVSFPRREQARAIAAYSSVAGIAVMSGPLTAGVLLDVVHWGWRSIFLINVPVSAAVVVAALVIVPESRAAEARRLDATGVVLVSTALFALVFGLIEGRALGWPAWTFAAMAAAAPLLTLFGRHERRVHARGGSPLVSPALLAQRSFSSGIVVVVVFFSGIVGFFLAFTIFLQLGLGYSALDSALTTFPSSVGLALAAQVSGKLAPRLGRRLLAAGSLVMALATVGLIVTVRANGAGLAPWDVRPVILVFGLGMGLIIPSLADVILADVEERHAGAASGVLNTCMQVGNAVGVAIIGVILFSALGSHASSSAASVQPRLARQLAAAGVPAAERTRVVAGFRACFVDRAHEEDPAAVPPSCRHVAPPAATIPLADASKRGRAADFVASIQRALSYDVFVFAATFALLLLLPGRRMYQTAGLDSPEVKGQIARRRDRGASSGKTTAGG
jgi:EmrB/QacA subfamily drug resistance transporter